LGNFNDAKFTSALDPLRQELKDADIEKAK